MRYSAHFSPQSWWLHLESKMIFVVLYNFKTDDDVEIHLLFVGQKELTMRLESALFEKLLNKEIEEIVK